MCEHWAQCTHWGDFNLEKCVSDVTRFHKFFITIYYILDKSNFKI